MKVFCRGSQWFLLFLLGMGCGRDRVNSSLDPRAGGSLVKWVDPFIGTGGHGHTFPGATLPHGMVQLSPDTRPADWDGSSGYHASDSLIYGFSHTHLSGTGVPDYCDILFMPMAAGPAFSIGFDGRPAYAAPFRKEDEIAGPGYYSVRFADSGILAELTATLRAGFHRYSFGDGDSVSVVLDLAHRDTVIASGLRVLNDREIEGYRISRDWADEQHVYFAAIFSRPFGRIRWESDAQGDPRERMLEGEEVRAGFRFGNMDGESLLLKVGISAVDMEGARRNLRAEIPHWDFDRTRREATGAWEQELGRIRIEAPADVMEIFYTAMYHNAIAPNLYSDVDGRYRGMDLRIHNTGGRDQYTIFSLWDTYRATHPLYTIIDRRRTVDYLRTLHDHYDKGGRLPMWELAANYTGCMIGYHAVPVILDAIQNGIDEFDTESAYRAAIETSNADELGKRDYIRCGFLSSEQEPESVSKTLEYAYDDWCIAQMAEMLGDSATAAVYYGRSQSWQNLVDPRTKLMRPKTDDRWLTPFNPVEVNYSFTEANSWQYSFYVPHDMEGFIRLCGGESGLEALLDSLFSTGTDTYGRDVKDITGMIGQYAHGNEPSHHIAYLYNYTGKPWKSQEIVRRIMAELYGTDPDGLAGNEDCGQMSAWYIFSALGFYPVTPGSGQYVFGSPVVDRATVQLENGNAFEIRTLRESPSSVYISEVLLDGHPYTKNYITHKQIMSGGQLEYVLADSPVRGRGTLSSDRPQSAIPDRYRVTPVPGIRRGGRTFTLRDTIGLDHIMPDAKIYYALGEEGPFEEWTSAIPIDSSVVIRAFAHRPPAAPSPEITAHFFRLPGDRRIRTRYPYASYYDAGGPLALIDFVKGDRDFRTGEWQGYQGVDLDATVEFGKGVSVNRVSIRFLQDIESWIFLPVEATFFVSADGEEFEELGAVSSDISPRVRGAVVEKFEVYVGREIRSLRILAKNRGVCPDWHKGAGGKAWIFADEITIE